jgi:hypothetical protein
VPGKQYRKPSEKELSGYINKELDDFLRGDVLDFERLNHNNFGG